MKPYDTFYQDPLCGARVAERVSFYAEHKGVAYYFCSNDCRRNFLSRRQVAQSVNHGTVKLAVDFCQSLVTRRLK